MKNESIKKIKSFVENEFKITLYIGKDLELCKILGQFLKAIKLNCVEKIEEKIKGLMPEFAQTFEGNELKIYILQDLQCDFKAYSLLNVDKEFKQIKTVKKMQGDLKDYMAEYEQELCTDVLSECFGK